VPQSNDSKHSELLEISFGKTADCTIIDRVQDGDEFAAFLLAPLLLICLDATLSDNQSGRDNGRDKEEYRHYERGGCEIIVSRYRQEHACNEPDLHEFILGSAGTGTPPAARR
jgi:hypothetical protein